MESLSGGESSSVAGMATLGTGQRSQGDAGPLPWVTMKILTLATPLNAPLRLCTGSADTAGIKLLPDPVADDLLAQQTALEELLGCTLSVEDWGFDC
ncbi:hypothetical protein [Stenotrophomonas sp. NPDC077659]|uniref:hypothetical protein n=1 Tax=Stenotrophomonas sp. NPDC077659 TaxID=3390694 RepID=UPI003CFF73ED